ncbi:MAG: hypothetical protein QGH62_07870, partial [Nitrospinaceae bacterium]|nr:hypothetical protein [Nitrospinaceae bacterium]
LGQSRPRYASSGGRDSGISSISERSVLDFRVCRGFDSLHPLHFSTLQSERFTATITQWGF